MRDAIAIVIGATGQTGELLTEELLNDNAFQKVRVLTRKPIAKSHDKLESVIVNFGSLSELKKAMGEGDIIF
ncbi:MAG TPA: NAD(P)H-binding protein, partial [Puia sp.]|nr:NAD(P)H-binding protein [Puia sp.]